MADSNTFQGIKFDKPDENPPEQIPPPGDDGLPQGLVFDDEKYTSVPQQALNIAEHLGHGVAGPIATAAEAGLTKLGVPGLSSEDQAARTEQNPIESGLSEGVGFVAPAILSLGATAETRAALEAAPTVFNAVSKVGAGAAKLSGLGGEGAGLVSKIAASGIRTGAEMAAIQTSDEISKAINQEPADRSLGTAAINIGLSGIIGGAGGSVLVLVRLVLSGRKRLDRNWSRESNF